MITKLIPKTITIDRKDMVSDFQNSKNVIKISNRDTAVLYITPAIKTFIRPKDMDALIIDLSWGCDYLDTQCDYIESEGDVYDLCLEMATGKSIIHEPRYISATLSSKDEDDAKYKVKKYKLDPTLPSVKQFLKGKKIKIYLHRYIMGMLSIGSVKNIKDRFGISDEQFNANGLSSLQVHHVDSEKMVNFSDKLIIVKPEKHSQLKREDPNAYNLYSSFLPIWNMDGSVWLELTDFESGKAIGFIIDLDNAGTNINFLKNYMAKEIKYSRDYMLMAEEVTEAFKRLPLCNKIVQSRYEEILEQMEHEGKIRIIRC